MSFADDFDSLSGDPEQNGWQERNEGSSPSGATRSGTTLNFPDGVANSSRKCILLAKTEVTAIQKASVTYVAANQADQVPCVYIKVNETIHAGIRAQVGASGTGLIISKVTDMNGATASVTKGSSAVGTTVGFTYTLEIEANGTSYTARLKNSGGTTIATVNWTDTDVTGDTLSSNFTGAHPSGVASSKITVWDNWTNYDHTVTNYTVSFSGANGTPFISNDATAEYPATFTLVRDNHTASVSITDITGEPAGITFPTQTAPGTGNSGGIGIVASGASLGTTTITVHFTDGSIVRTATLDLTIVAPTLGVDVVQGAIAGSSTPTYADLYGDLRGRIATRHGAPNAKSATRITDGSYAAVQPGAGTAYYAPYSAFGDLLPKIINYCGEYGVNTLYAIPWCTSDAATAFSTIAANFDAALDCLLAHGINVVFLKNFYRLDTSTENVGGGGALVSAISGSGTGNIFSITGYTFDNDDIGRIFAINRGVNTWAYGFITAVDTNGATSCTIDFPFETFTPTTSMLARVYTHNGKAAAITEYNTEVAKRAHDSGDAAAKSNGTRNTKVYVYPSINGRDTYLDEREYLNVDLTHRDAQSVGADGHEMTADMFDRLMAYHVLKTYGTVTNNPQTDAIEVDETVQIVPEVTGFASLGWTGGYPGPMVAAATLWEYAVDSGPGNVDTDGTFTADEGDGEAVVSATNLLASELTDTTTITINAADAIPPEIDAAETDTDGLQIAVDFDGTVEYDDPDPAHWAVRQNGVAVTVNDVDFVSNQALLATNQLHAGKTTVVDFLGGANVIQDAAGNDLEAISDVPVTNNSTVYDYVDPDPEDIEGLASLITGGANILSRLPRG